ncbi:MAG TPA: GNAT family N-acetyltransferase [Thermotogota bacterium]|nr:GNAT family N-acetyltransferase [Thermotogota bacterium]HRW93221.1 GNAT family N-acetyltransferase [Thermotogota bacterium]
MEILPLKKAAVTTLIHLVNEIFEDYPLPVNWREEDFELDVRENAISWDDSFLLVEGSQPIGFLLLSERGHTARIDSMGVVRAQRGTGASEILLQQALENLRWKNTKRLILEVIETDPRAIRFYEKHGFSVVRDLLTLEISTNPGITPRWHYRPITPRGIHELAQMAQDIWHRKPNWQRQPATLHDSQDRYSMEAIYVNRTGGSPIGYLVWGKGERGFFVVDSFVVDPAFELVDIVHDCLLHVNAQTKSTVGTLANIPREDPLCQVFLQLGARELFKQLEMEMCLH